MPGESASANMEESTPQGNNNENQEVVQEETDENNEAPPLTEEEMVEPEKSADNDNIDAKDNDERKMFVGGLSRDTTTQNLKDYFAQFGEVVDVSIKTDVVTGRSRGFGFILFGDLSTLDKVTSQKTHTLNGRTIDPKRAKAKDGHEPIKKIFVGGLDPNFPEDDIREYFSKFGKIEKIELPFDKIKSQRRGFCFITFESEEIVDTICKQPKQKIGTKECDVKKATPVQDPKKGSFSTRGGRGRGNSNQNQWSTWGSQGYNYNQGYGGYSQGYGSYGNYSGYGYGQGYDYSGWGDQTYGGSYGYGSGYGASQQPATYGKSLKNRNRNTNFHPYNRQ